MSFCIWVDQNYNYLFLFQLDVMLSYTKSSWSTVNHLKQFTPYEAQLQVWFWSKDHYSILISTHSFQSSLFSIRMYFSFHSLSLIPPSPSRLYTSSGSNKKAREEQNEIWKTIFDPKPKADVGGTIQLYKTKEKKPL